MSFDDLLKELQGQKSTDDNPNHISLEKLFHEAFMRQHSNCQTFDQFLDKGNFQAKTQEDINDIPEELFDRHVARETSFPDWQSMLDAAMKNQGACCQNDSPAE